MDAVIYSNGNQECERAKSFLDSQGISYTTYELGKDFTEKQFTTEFGVVEYPQVNIGYTHVGGLKETLTYVTRSVLVS